MSDPQISLISQMTGLPPQASTDDACAFLADRYGVEAQNVSEIGRGEWSVAYGFRHAGRDLVARFGLHREDFEKDRLAAGHASADLPVPAVLEIGEAFGGFYALSERVRGTFLNELTCDATRACLPGLFSTLDAARRADVSASSGYGGWDATGNAPHGSWSDALTAVGVDSTTHRTYGWRERMAASHVGIGQFDEALVCLRSLAGSMPARRHLIHNDLLARNVFVEGNRISGVIDWGCGMYGDFVYDLALLVFWGQWFDGWRGIDLAAEAERHYEAIGLHVPRFRERLRCCQLSIGLDGCAYQAFRGRWSELEVTMGQVQGLVRQRP